MLASPFVRGLAAALLIGPALPAHALLPIQHWQTSTGARVYFIENRDLPMLDVSVEFPGGMAFDRPDKGGVASMTNRLLDAGADGLSEDDIARALADVGAGLGSRFDTDRSGMGIRTLSSAKERGRALDILARVLRSPSFPPAVLEREKVRVIGSIKESDTQPGTIASLNFYRLVYPGHPYGRRGSGEVEAVQKMTRADLVEFHRRHYVSQRATVAMIGDVSRAEAEAIAEELTRGLPRADDGAAPEVPAVPPLAAGAARRIPHHAQQAHILIGSPGVRRDDPDYIPLYVGNYVLGGGGLVSRMSVEVRGKRGLAYSAYSYFSPYLREGPFVIGMQTQREQAGQALEVANTVLREFLERGPTEAEVAAAKKGIIGGFPLRIDTNRKIQGYLALIGFYRLPLTYLEDFQKRVEAVTIPEIRAAFKRHVDADRLVTVVVGPAPEKSARAEAH
jgi:zinc protease